MSLSSRLQTGTYGKPDRYYETLNYDPCIWTVFWLIMAFDDRYDEFGDTEQEVLDFKRDLFKRTWEEMTERRAGTGNPENFIEAL